MSSRISPQWWDNVFSRPFKLFKCRHLQRFGWKGVVAGLPKRPGLPNAAKTMEYVTGYLSKLQGIALNEPIFFRDLQPECHFEPLAEISVAERHNRYAAFMKKKRKVDGSAVEFDDN